MRLGQLWLEWVTFRNAWIARRIAVDRRSRMPSSMKGLRQFGIERDGSPEEGFNPPDIRRLPTRPADPSRG